MTRIFKLIRFLRVIKILMLSKKINAVIRQLSSKRNNVMGKAIIRGIQQVLKQIVIILFFNHLMACVWYMVAKFNDLPRDCWVVRKEAVDEDHFRLYLISFHWSI